jgi:DNA-binding transcriptional LysR family regulator
MDLHKLKCFCTVADAASLRQASEVLRLSPGAVSKAVKSLEDSLGSELFTMSGRSLVLTSEGKTVYERGTKILLEYAEMERCIGNSKGSRRKVLRLGTYCLFTTNFLDSVLASELLGIELLQKRIPPNDLEEAILNHSVDVGLTFLPYARPGLDFLPVAEFSMGIFSLLNKFKNQSLEKIPFVSSVTDIKGSAFNVRTIDGWPHQNIHRNITYRVAGLDAALAIARQGLAAVYCPAFTIAMHNKTIIENHKLFPFETAEELSSQKYTVYLVKRSSDKEDNVMKKLSSAVRRVCKEMPLAASYANL